MTKKYQFRVEVNAYDFIFAVGAEALAFARSAAEHSIPSKYSCSPVICITIEEVPEEEPKEQEEGADD